MLKPARPISWYAIAYQFVLALVAAAYVVDALTEDEMPLLFGAKRVESPIVFWSAASLFAAVAISALWTSLLFYRQRRRTLRTIIASPDETSSDNLRWRKRT